MPEPTAHAGDTVTLDTSPSMAMTTLYGAAIGPIGSDYYLPIFERFEAVGQGTLSWNWSACLYNLNWMIFRGLWGVVLVAAGALAGATLLLVALGRLVFDWPAELLYGLLLTCLALVFLVAGAWGNALLYNHSRAAMMTAVANNKTLVQACVELSRHASSRERFIRILVVNLAWIALASMAYVLLPSNNPSALPASAEPLAVPALSRASRPTRATEPAVSAAEPTASAASAARATASATEPPASDVATAASAPVKVASASALSVTSTASAAPQALPFASAPAQARSKAVSASAVAASKEAPLPQPAAEMNAKSTASAAAQTEEVYVNAGLFADPDNARRTLARLIEVGLPATAQELQTSHGVRTRVRVGPFANQAHAELAVRHIKAMNLDAVLAKP